MLDGRTDTMTSMTRALFILSSLSRVAASAFKPTKPRWLSDLGDVGPLSCPRTLSNQTLTWKRRKNWPILAEEACWSDLRAFPTACASPRRAGRLPRRLNGVSSVLPRNPELETDIEANVTAKEEDMDDSFGHSQVRHGPSRRASAIPQRSGHRRRRESAM